MKQHFYLQAVFISVLVLAGCGGGKKDAPDPNAALNGVYYMAGLNINNTGGVSSELSTIVFNGKGRFDFSQTYSREDAANQVKTDSGTYTVDAGGKLTFTVKGEVTDGWLSADAKTFVAARINSATVNNINIGVKAGSGLTDASLVGDYRKAELLKNSAGWSAEIAPISFGGVGGFGTYAVADNGGVTFGTEPETTNGWLSADAQTFIAARINSKEVHNLNIGIKTGIGFSASSLNGVYYAAFLRLELDDEGPRSLLMKITFDGTNEFETEWTCFNPDSGKIETDTDSKLGYTVTDDGSLTLEAVSGYLSADARTFILVRNMEPYLIGAAIKR
jgi:hypothetical protein